MMVEEKEGAQENAQEKKLKPAQVAASALAAVTAAFVGSTLGVGGTVAGAGLASVVTTVGSEVYLRGTRLAARRTKDVLGPADSGPRERTRAIEPPRPLANPVKRQADPTVRLPRRTQALPAAGRGPARVPPRAEQPTVFMRKPKATASGPAPPPWESPPWKSSQRKSRRSKSPWWKGPWTIAIGTCLAAFVVGMLIITGFETITGHPVSGGSGTTISRLANVAPADPQPATVQPSLLTPGPATPTETRTAGPSPTTRKTGPSSTTRAPASTSASTSAPSSAASSVEATPTGRASAMPSR